MDTLPLWLLAAIFVAGAAVIWVAGIQLSKNDRRPRLPTPPR
jgi:cation:H+ antiporter